MRQTSPHVSIHWRTHYALYYCGPASPTRFCASTLGAIFIFSAHSNVLCRARTQLTMCWVTVLSTLRTILIPHSCMVSNGLPSIFIEIPSLNYGILGKNHSVRAGIRPSLQDQNLLRFINCNKGSFLQINKQHSTHAGRTAWAWCGDWGFDKGLLNHLSFIYYESPGSSTSIPYFVQVEPE